MSNWGLSAFHKNFSELFLVVVLSALSWLDIDKDELDVVVLVLLPPVVPVLDVAVVVVLLVWSWLLGSFFTTLTWLLEVAEAEAVSVASALCQLVNSWETKWRSLSRYWLYNSTSLWPAPCKETKNGINHQKHRIFCSLEISWNPQLLRNGSKSSSSRWSRLCATKNGKNIVAFSVHKRSSGLGVKQVHCINHLGAAAFLKDL